MENNSTFNIQHSKLQRHSRIFVAGGTGLVGSAIIKKLHEKGYTNIVASYHSRPPLTNNQSTNPPITWQQLDLIDSLAVSEFFAKEQPEFVFLAAAKVGGIVANSTYPADFIYINTMIAANTIHTAYKTGVKKLLNLGSSCIYPKHAPQPLKEEYLLTGPLEDTNEAYAIAKITAIKLCKHYNNQYGTNFISLMPTNLYGPGDNYDLETSHVLAAFIRKFHEGKINGGPILLWGDGSPRREFLYSDDLADAAVYFMENNDYKDIGEFVNVGTGKDIPIKDLAELVASIVGYKGEIEWDTSKPNGMPRKLLDISKLTSLGWHYKTTLSEGIRKTYEEYCSRCTKQSV